MIAPLDLTTEEMEVYKILYSKMDFETYLVKYTLDQIVNDSNSKLLMTKKKASLIIKHFISDNLLTVEEKGSKGNPTVYKITKINDILEKHKRTLNETQTELKGNLNETNNPSDTNGCEDIEKHKSNSTETQTELKGNTKVTPIKDKENDNKKDNIISMSAEQTPYEDIKNLFNSICITLPKIKSISANRQKTVKARWRENPNIEFFRELFNTVNNSSFLRGNEKWKNNCFDWIMAPSNMQKILEGNYDNKKTANSNDWMVQ